MAPDWSNPYEIKWVTKNKFAKRVEEARKEREKRSNRRLAFWSIICFVVGMILFLCNKF